MHALERKFDLTIKLLFWPTDILINKLYNILNWLDIEIAYNTSNSRPLSECTVCQCDLIVFTYSTDKNNVCYWNFTIHYLPYHCLQDKTGRDYKLMTDDFELNV